MLCGRGRVPSGAAPLVGEAFVMESSMTRPHIVFLMTDQHRFDCLGCYGNKAIRTPHIDRIAQEGVTFEHAYTSTPTCCPARAAILTGQNPWHHGQLAMGRLATRYPIELPRLLAAAGYYTYAIGKLHYYPQRNLHGFHGAMLDEASRGVAEGFVSDYRQYFWERAPDLDPDATGIGPNDHRSRVYVLPEELHPTHWTGQTAVRFIEGYQRQDPLFLKVSFVRPHSPYDPPQRFWDMYRDEDMPAQHVGNWAARYAPRSSGRDDLWHGELGAAQVRRSRRGYYGSISFIDEQVGQIMSALAAREMLENTLVLFTTDHGDMTGDHHLWRKSYPYEASAHIPLLLRWPESSGMEERRGQRLPQPVELRDLLPTFLDAAGEPVPEGVDGDSLLRLVRGQTSGWRPWIDLEHAQCYSERNNWNALTDGRWKYIYHAYSGEEMLFHLTADRGELHDLASNPSHAVALARWRGRLVEHLHERGPAWVKDGQLVPRPQQGIYSPNYPEGER
ncbi:MAG: arylsulfatase [Armatimonadota bacterium]|nr:MAG: arylsulfatase [Armatimonadota bacterium]